MTLVQANAGNSDTTSQSEEQDPNKRTDTLMNGVRTVETREDLITFNKPTTELVIWERSLPSGFKEWIDHIDTSNLPDTRFLVQPNDLCSALGPMLGDCSLPAGQMRDFILEDIDRLVTVFAEITNSDLVDIRLERIEHNACWKFHRDTVEARLVTTYRGPTTEWVQMIDAERAIDEQTDYDGPLEHLGDGHVAFFKGSCAGHNSGIVHRSPPIKGTGCTRLLLCLNKRTIVSPDPWVRY